MGREALTELMAVAGQAGLQRKFVARALGVPASRLKHWQRRSVPPCFLPRVVELTQTLRKLVESGSLPAPEGTLVWLGLVYLSQGGEHDEGASRA